MAPESRFPRDQPDVSSAGSTHHSLKLGKSGMRWAVATGLVFMTGVGMVLLFLLTVATRNRALYEQNFSWLVGVNVAVAVLLSLILLWLVVRLALRLKRGKFGSRLLIKLASIIGLVGV